MSWLQDFDIEFINNISEHFKSQPHWTKRDDRTFTGLDLVRIFLYWLDDEEQDFVADFFAYGTFKTYETLLAETWNFFNEVTLFFQDLFTLRFISAWHRYQKLLTWRKRLIQKWLDVFLPEPKPPGKRIARKEVK